jgi:recombination protein RecR
MNLPSKRLDQAVQAFSQLPGIGQKTALRLVLYLLKKDNSQVNQFAAAFDKLNEEINGAFERRFILPITQAIQFLHV